MKGRLHLLKRSIWVLHGQQSILGVYSKIKNRDEPGREKICLMSYANNKGADQPAHPSSLISAFIVRCLDSIISLNSISEISRLLLASVAGWFVTTLVRNSWRHIMSCRSSHDMMLLCKSQRTFSVIQGLTSSNSKKLLLAVAHFSTSSGTFHC